MGRVKQIDIKNRTYYFYDDMIIIKKFDSNLLKIDKRSYKDSITTLNILKLKKLMIMKIFIVSNYWSRKWVYWGKRDE